MSNERITRKQILGKKTASILLLLLVITLIPVNQYALASENDWLNYVNYYRAMAKLPTVTSNSNYSGGCYKHARYMVKNDVIEHYENTNNSWYTPEGLAAAKSSNLYVTSDALYPNNGAIDGWMQGPFHALGIINPKLKQVGFGGYRENDGGWQMGAALDVIRGIDSSVTGIQYPITWPSGGKTVRMRQYDGGEWPNPLSGLTGYSAPTGLPILLQLGNDNITPKVTASSFTTGGSSLEHVTYNETNYYNSDKNTQNLARSILDDRDAIVLIPRKPLEFSKKYNVSITVNGEKYAWSFYVTNEVSLNLPAVSSSITKIKTFKVSWLANDPPPGDTIYTVKYRKAGSGVWNTWKLNTKSTYGYFEGKAGDNYYFRVYAKYANGKSAVSRTGKIIIPFDNNSFIYSRNGFDKTIKRDSSNHFFGTVRYSTVKNKSITYKFSGKSLRVISTRGSGYSRAKIYIDGKYITTVDAYSAIQKYRQIIFKKIFDKSGTRKIRIENLASPGRPRFDIDALAVGV